MLRRACLHGIRVTLCVLVGAWLLAADPGVGVRAQPTGLSELVVVDVVNTVLWKHEGTVDVIGLLRNQSDGTRAILGLEGTVVDAAGRPIATLQGEPLVPVVPGWHRIPFRAGGTVPESMDRIRWDLTSEPAELVPVFMPIESLAVTTRPPGIGGIVADVTGTIRMPEETTLRRVVVAVTLLDETGAPVAVDASGATGLEPGGSHPFTFSLPKLSPVDQLVYGLEFLAVGWSLEEAAP